MTSDDPLECFEIECDEDETDCTKCFACELEKKLDFGVKPCGHLMCTSALKKTKVKCHAKIDSKLAIFFDL